MSASRPDPRPRKRRTWRRLAEDRRGATAVEFALVATPYLLLVMAAFEICFVYAASVAVDAAVASAARQVMTGQMQGTGTATATTFKNQICANIGWLQSDCQTNMSVDVETFTAFASISPPSTRANGAFTSQNLGFNLGGPGTIVVVNAYYRWPLMLPVFTSILNATTSNQAVIQSTFAFRNEPYAAQ